MAASETARRLQAMYDGTSLLVRRRTISYLADLITPSAAATVRPGLRSAASSTVAVPRTTSSLGDRSIAAARPRALGRNSLPDVHGTNFHHRFVASILLLLSNVNLRHFYIITLLMDIVRRPCCVSALTSP